MDKIIGLDFIDPVKLKFRTPHVMGREDVDDFLELLAE